MSNYLSAPVAASDFLGRFRLQKPKGEADLPFTEDHAAELAALVNRAIEIDRSAVWFNPETDKQEVRVHGAPVYMSGRAVQLASRQEVAVFPSPSVLAS